MPRLLMTADAVGGVWTYSLDLARALSERGVSTTLAVMGPRPSTDQVENARAIPGLDLAIGDFPLEWMQPASNDMQDAGKWLLDLEEAARPCLIHLNGYAHAALPWPVPVVSVAHSCVLSWMEGVGERLSGEWIDEYRARTRDGLRAADWIVAPSAPMLESLQRHYGPLGRVSVIANGRDRRRLSPCAKEPFVFAAGRLWDRAKNIETVRAIAPTLSWPVKIAGDGGAAGAIDLGRLSEREMAAWLGCASIFVLPARYEPFGLLPLEAALSGCALVLGDIPSLCEVWADAADFVDPSSPEALRTAIEGLIADPDRRARRAAAARRRALQFTPARMANQYLAVYSRLAGTSIVSGDLRTHRCAS